MDTLFPSLLGCLVRGKEARLSALKERLSYLSTSSNIKQRAPMRLWVLEDQIIGLEAELKALKGEK